MSAMQLPKYDDLLVATLDALDGLGGSGTIEEIDDRVVAAVGLTEEQQAITYEKSGALVVPDRCSWARSYLKIAGLLDSAGRGVWVITEEGRRFRDLGEQAIRRRVAEAANERSRAYNKARAQQAEAAGMPEASAETEAPPPELDWTTQVLSVLGKMPPDAFERLCQRLLRESGFVKVEVTGRSGDGGIDGNGVLRVRLVSFQVLFQSKRWQSPVGSSVVRDFRGAMVGRADKGLIITTSTFTKDARAEATRDGAPAIDLVDGEELCRLLKETRIGVRVEMVEEVSVDENVFAAI